MARPAPCRCRTTYLKRNDSSWKGLGSLSGYYLRISLSVLIGQSGGWQEQEKKGKEQRWEFQHLRIITFKVAASHGFLFAGQSKGEVRSAPAELVCDYCLAARDAAQAARERLLKESGRGDNRIDRKNKQADINRLVDSALDH